MHVRAGSCGPRRHHEACGSPLPWCLLWTDQLCPVTIKLQAHVAPATSMKHVEALMELLLQNGKIR